MLEALVDLFFPEICQACGNALFNQEKLICTFCSFHLPQTHYHHQKNNPVSKLFWGRAAIETAAAFYFFNKGSRVQRLLHQLKYRGRSDLAIHVGYLYGTELKQSPLYADVDLIIPIPLHKKKLKQRGYNQSDAFARGLSQGMLIEWDAGILERTIANETQTNKSRFERWTNVASIFAIKNPDKLKNKHILLVDDVITTGSTLEAAATLILSLNQVKLSIVSMACSLKT